MTPDGPTPSTDASSTALSDTSLSEALPMLDSHIPSISDNIALTFDDFPPIESLFGNGSETVDWVRFAPNPDPASKYPPPVLWATLIFPSALIRSISPNEPLPHRPRHMGALTTPPSQKWHPHTPVLAQPILSQPASSQNPRPTNKRICA